MAPVTQKISVDGFQFFVSVILTVNVLTVC